MMLKDILLLILTVALLATGTQNKTVQAPIPAENPSANQQSAGQAELPGSDADSRWDAYIISVEEQSEAIKSYLEYEAMTQLDMNEKSQELYELWDKALNDLWAEIRARLPEDEFISLRDEQRLWIAEKEKAVEEAGKEFEGGSVYPLIVNSEAARITEARTYELYELLKQTDPHS